MGYQGFSESELKLAFSLVRRAVRAAAHDKPAKEDHLGGRADEVAERAVARHVPDFGFSDCLGG